MNVIKALTEEEIVWLKDNEQNLQGRGRTIRIPAWMSVERSIELIEMHGRDHSRDCHKPMDKR